MVVAIAVTDVGSQRLYRLVDPPGLPCPVLDEVYDSLDTACGDWRTLRYPGC